MAIRAVAHRAPSRRDTDALCDAMQSSCDQAGSCRAPKQQEFEAPPPPHRLHRCSSAITPTSVCAPHTATHRKTSAWRFCPSRTPKTAAHGPLNTAQRALERVLLHSAVVPLGDTRAPDTEIGVQGSCRPRRPPALDTIYDICLAVKRAPEATCMRSSAVSIFRCKLGCGGGARLLLDARRTTPGTAAHCAHNHTCRRDTECGKLDARRHVHGACTVGRLANTPCADCSALHSPSAAAVSPVAHRKAVRAQRTSRNSGSLRKMFRATRIASWSFCT